MERSVNVRFRTLRILIAVRPHTERVRIARPEEISRRIVQRQQRQSRLPAATKLSRSDMDVVVVLEGIKMNLSSSRAELLSRAASRSPARAIASGGEGGGARPRAADAQLVGGGEGVCFEHVAHVRDAGGVPAERLVEGRHALPRVASRAHGAERAAGWEAERGERLRCARSMQGGGRV